MQVILSPYEEFAVGVEALVRGVDLNNNETIPPNILFEKARDEGLVVELDKLCVKKAIEAFVPIYNNNKSTLLFINIENTFINYCIETDYLLKCIKDHDISFENIVIDISNFDMYSIDQIEQFIDKYRQRGFYISIDDIGGDYFNLDKIVLVNPDIIKINNVILKKLKNKYYKKNLPNLISSIAHEMGIIVIAKGIEETDEFISSIELGAQFIQGYIISKPKRLSNNNIKQIIDDFKENTELNTYFERKKILNQRENINRRQAIAKLISFMEKIREDINKTNESNINETVKNIFNKHQYIENGWVLDKDGIQISDAMINKEIYATRNLSIFHIYKKGMDFSNKDIFCKLKDTILDVWVTEPYISLLTNNICVGASVYIKNEHDEKNILCLNINYNNFIKEHMK